MILSSLKAYFPADIVGLSFNWFQGESELGLKLLMSSFYCSTLWILLWIYSPLVTPLRQDGQNVNTHFRHKSLRSERILSCSLSYRKHSSWSLKKCWLWMTSLNKLDQYFCKQIRINCVFLRYSSFVQEYKSLLGKQTTLPHISRMSFLELHTVSAVWLTPINQVKKGLFSIF